MVSCADTKESLSTEETERRLHLLSESCNWEMFLHKAQTLVCCRQMLTGTCLDNASIDRAGSIVGLVKDGVLMNEERFRLLLKVNCSVHHT